MPTKRPPAGPDCDCCSGVDAVTPQRITNPPGQSQVAYRMGRHGDYVESMRARLSGTNYPALAALTTREASDFTLAISDALACSLDVLGFYTERFAQEHYLRTATERLSVREMARLIGYQLAPGAAAGTHLAFTLQATPGAPAEPIVIPVGTRVQSVPGQDEKAQSFETTFATPARAAWNAIPVQQAESRTPAFGDTRLWLAGLDSGLAVGDLLLIVGAEHESDPANERWDVRVVTALKTHTDRGLTEVRWQTGLGHSKPFVLPADKGVRVFSFRARAAAFGSSAPDWRALSDSMKADYIGLADEANLLRPGDTEEWPDFSVLAPVYPERRTGSGALEASVFAASLDDIVAAAKGAAQGAATMAMHKAAAAGTGIVLAGAEVGTAAMAMTRESLNELTELTKQAAYQGFIAEVDRAIGGSIVLNSGRRAPLVRAPDTIDIFPANDAVVAGSWALLAVPGSVELYRITASSTASRAQYLLSGQTTRMRLSGELTGGRLPAAFEHAVRALAVHVDSAELPLARPPLDLPVYGERIALDTHAEGLVPGQALALFGKRQRLVLARGAVGLALTGEDGSTRALAQGDDLLLIDAPVRLVGSTPHYLDPQAFGAAVGDASVRLRLRLQDRDGLIGLVTLRGNDIALAASHGDDAELAEIVFLAATNDAISQTRDRTVLTLATSTRHCYQRRFARINANVAPATHGESVQAILGNGDGQVSNARFNLTQAPLTFVSANTPSGRASTLELRVNDVLWHEVPSLHAAKPGAHEFETRQDDEAITSLVFGDGVNGARLPSGSSNLRVHYRKGLGTAGNLDAGKLTTLLSRPLGVSGAHNPEPATGGEDAETLERARDNAPLTVLTLDRAVSIDDYAHFARAFAGIDKSHALWIPAGPARGVFLTIAGVDGAQVPPSSDTYKRLREAIATYGDPLVPLRMANYSDVRFVCRLSVRVLDTHEADAVLAAMETALRTHFSFARRAFGQTVSVDEVAAVAHGVDGVAAVQVNRLHRSGLAPSMVPRLFARLPVASLTALAQAAELLTLADAPLALEVMA